MRRAKKKCKNIDEILWRNSEYKKSLAHVTSALKQEMEIPKYLRDIKTQQSRRKEMYF